MTFIEELQNASVYLLGFGTGLHFARVFKTACGRDRAAAIVLIVSSGLSFTRIFLGGW